MDKRRVVAEAALLPQILRLEDPGPQGLHSRIQSTCPPKKGQYWIPGPLVDRRGPE
ncbi:hypothetical protein N656DRAFT_802561 [Canariomyces notabilis]|uniref:Uncharacterized protein n=1 Tax=Canariomyces notabilis TaxID=2074819 RepID=A0AAN6QHS5_9PEZI|nr:hypothetical protein N656DRAFT_802561 [Canariomyces arenarius]